MKNNRVNSVVENIYSLVNYDILYDVDTIRGGNIAYQNVDNATIQNVYSVGIGENNTDLTTGPNVYNKTSKKIYNSYYFNDEIFTSELELKGNKLSLWDAEFQNQIINNNGAFNVNELVNSGYFPHLNMPDVMPLQDYIELPDVVDSDLPDILSTKVLEQGTNTVKVEFSVNNPSAETISDIKIENLNVEIISQEYKDGKSTVIVELNNPIVCVSSYNVLSISTKGAFNNSYTREYEKGERVIYVDLYKEIWNVQDWKNINDSPTENYILMEDINFINEANIEQIYNIDGIFNGNGHTISNINMINHAFINRVNGTIENLYVNNFNQNSGGYCGLIYSTANGAIVNNIHINNMNIIKSSGNMSGGLVTYADRSSIKNCSINNITMNVDMNDSQIIGGLVGSMSNSNIDNSYVQGLKINSKIAVDPSIGGLVGSNIGVCSIKNCYVEGTIFSENINVGGIIGKATGNTIENCYAKVDISTENNFVGGIVGAYTGTISNISNNVTIGNIYTTSGVENINRIVGNNSDTEINYAYENQLLNGYKSNEKKGATLLSKKEILDLNLGNYYDYTSKEKEILPKLYNMEGTELLPNQKDIYIEGEDSIKLEIESAEATKPNTTEAEINIRINNPNEVEITEIIIEDMKSEITRNITQKGITNITLRSTPERYYDNYKLTEIRYKLNDLEEQTKEVEAEIKVQFYKEIYTYEDWQSIEEGTYQNYRLMADIDFTGKTNIKNNITVNRLESENNIYTLKNINLEFNKANSGLIQNVKISMKNISFENITLINKEGSGNYFGIIANNNGDLENLRFKNVTIDAEKMSHVGIIGMNNSANINNVQIDTLNVNGNEYIGGLIGELSISNVVEIKDIEENNITIKGNGRYTGGLIGYGNTLSSSDIQRISIIDSNVMGKNYTGSVIGSVNAGKFRYIEVNNTNISGTIRVGGIFGFSSSSEREFIEIKHSNIVGSDNYIGGIGGDISSSLFRNIVVNDCHISAESQNSEGIGGIAGCFRSATIDIFQVEDVKITGNGNKVGLVVGYNNTNYPGSIQRGYIYNSTAEGNAQVGGVYGNTKYGTIHDIYVNAQIKANNNTAGGIIGYMDNTDMTGANFTISIYNVIVSDSTIEAPSKAGGLIGDITKEIYRDKSYYYNNYIDADVTSENESTGSLIIGGRTIENQYITNTYVYKYGTLNGDYVYATNDNIDDDQYLERADLDIQSTFQTKIGLGTTNWNYASLQEGKYPTIKDQYLYKPELQTGVDLPTDPEIVDVNSLDGKEDNDTSISTQSVEALPEVKVYPISVNEINIDFSGIPDNTNFTYYINGSEIETINLTEKTYTFKYNFEDELEIKLTNGVDEETITINPDSVKSNISLIGEDYAYLNGNKLYINGKVQSGEYVNVYDGYALNDNGEVLNIETMQTIGNTETSLEEVSKPLHMYEYKGSSIEVYGTYSKIDGNVKSQIYNVKSGKLSALSNSLDIKTDNYIVDYYNDKEYQTILTSSGEIVDLKEQLQYPSNFLNRNVKQIVQNSEVEKPEMMVIYNTGKVIVFNYVNGNVIYETEEKADSGLTDYITGSINSIWSDYESKQSEYLRSKELIAKLAEMPIEEVLNEVEENANNTIESINNINIGNISSNITNNTTSTNEESYITVYNGETGEYEVYSETEILEGTEEDPISETEKIKKNGLENIYNYEQEEETKSKVNGSIIVAIIIGIAIISLIILRKLIYRNNTKK